MPKATKIPGLTDYGDDDNAPPKQTVFPKAQGGGQASPSSSPGKETSIPGLKDYGGNKPPPADQGSAWNDILHPFHAGGIFDPQPADLSRPQTWHDWLTKTYSPSASDVGTAALDDASFGTADWIQSKATGENIANIRARTADAQAAMGPAGPLVNAVTYAVPGAGVAKGLEAAGQAGKVAGALGRYGQAALEGGTASAASSVGHQAGGYIDPLKVAKDAGTGAVFGLGGQAIGDAAAGAVRNVSNYVRGSPGRSGEQWKWRERAAAGDPTLPDDIALLQTALPADHPAQPALTKTQDALAQSTEPGRVANSIYGVTGTVAGAYGVPPDFAIGGGLLGLTAGEAAKNMFGSPGAKAINTLDRNINVGQSLDQLYPALYGPQTSATGALRPALDTSGWADAIRQMTIGSERPGPPGSQLW